MEIALKKTRININFSRNVAVPELFQKIPLFFYGPIFIAVR